MWKTSFKTQRGRIPIDPAILVAIGYRFIANKKKIKNADARVWGDAHRDQKPETFFGGPNAAQCDQLKLTFAAQHSRGKIVVKKMYIIQKLLFQLFKS